MGNDLFTKLTDKYPFITLCVYATNEYIGIVQNQDDAITTIYDFGAIQDLDTKKKFLENNKNWKIKEVFTNNNGLTILNRN